MTKPSTENQSPADSQKQRRPPRPAPTDCLAEHQATITGSAPAEAAAAENGGGLEAVRTQLEALEKQLEGVVSQRGDLDGIAEKFQGMEDRLSILMQLSEVLSVQYNPFLERNEPDVFEGRHAAGDLLPGLRNGTLPPEVVRMDAGAGAEHDAQPDGPAMEPEAWHEPETAAPASQEPTPEDAATQQAPSGPDAAHRPADTEPVPTERPAAHAPAPTPSADLPSWQAEAQRRPDSMIHTKRGRTREAYLALCWMEHMLERVPAAGLHKFLDQYRWLGWLSPDDHTWLSRIAHSMASPADLAWEDMGLEPADLASLHRQNLRLFDHMFRQGFEEAAPDRWCHEVASRMGGK